MATSFFEENKLGKSLSKARNKLGISIKEASEATRIRAEFLESLENGNYENLPAEVYTRGFIKNYSQFLKLNPKVTLALYRRETPKAVVVDNLKPDPTNKKIENRFRITQEKLLLFSIVLFISVFGIYIFTRLTSVIQPPELSLTNPVQVSGGSKQEYKTTQNKISLKGKLDVGSSLKINDVAFDTKNLEVFEISDLELKDGENTFNLKATSSFGIESEIILNVIKESTSTLPTDNSDEENNQVTSGILIEIITGPEEGQLEITLDDGQKITLNDPPGTVKTYRANTKVSIRANKNNTARIALNGDEFNITSGLTRWELINNKVTKL